MSFEIQTKTWILNAPAVKYCNSNYFVIFFSFVLAFFICIFTHCSVQMRTWTCDHDRSGCAEMGRSQTYEHLCLSKAHISPQNEYFRAFFCNILWHKCSHLIIILWWNMIHSCLSLPPLLSVSLLSHLFLTDSLLEAGMGVNINIVVFGSVI